ncbi:MAG: sugar ABC transporter substrate-binding protein [Defluviitaleaceae bacterium]|nr:sugar ABC transporter substrate-binding protein [Defluviitaleaceae bacterium]
MKKIFALCFLLAVAVGLLAACGNDDADGPVTIRFSMWDTVDESASFIQAFHAVQDDIRIEIVSIPEDYSTVINTMVIGGTAPDVILAWEVDMPRFAANGNILRLNDRINASDLVRMDDFMAAVDGITDVTGGGLYGIPWVYAGHFLYFNKDMFDAAGIPYPTDNWTWDDMAAAAQALTIRDGASTTQWGLAPIDFGGIWYSMIGQAGDAVVDANMNLSMGPGLRRTLEFMYRLTNEYQVTPQPGGGLGDLFAAGMAAMTRQGNWFVPGYADVPFRWDIVPLPRDSRAHTALHTGFFTINAQSDHPEEAWTFIEWMMSYNGQRELSQFSANPSAMMSVAAQGYHRVAGQHGPTNWGAFDYFNHYGAFTFVLLNSSVTGNLVSQFDSVLLGINSIDHVINVEIPAAQRELDALR